MTANMIIKLYCDCGEEIELDFDDLVIESYPCDICGNHLKVYVLLNCPDCNKVITYYFRNDKY